MRNPLLVSMVGLVVLLAGCSSAAAAPSASLRGEPPKTLDVAAPAEIPAQYTDAGGGLAFQWATEDDRGYQCDEDGPCSVIEVYAYEACPNGVTIRAEVVDGDDVADEREGSLASLAEGESAFISLGVLDAPGTYITVADALCS